MAGAGSGAEPPRERRAPSGKRERSRRSRGAAAKPGAAEPDGSREAGDGLGVAGAARVSGGAGAAAAVPAGRARESRCPEKGCGRLPSVPGDFPAWGAGRREGAAAEPTPAGCWELWGQGGRGVSEAGAGVWGAGEEAQRFLSDKCRPAAGPAGIQRDAAMGAGEGHRM
ncbi:unnamed protein product, partial [Lepidochelys kempii]